MESARAAEYEANAQKLQVSGGRRSGRLAAPVQLLPLTGACAHVYMHVDGWTNGSRHWYKTCACACACALRQADTDKRADNTKLA